MIYKKEYIEENKEYINEFMNIPNLNNNEYNNKFK